MARADKFTLTRKKQVLYRDFTNNFTKNPFTGYLGVVENEDAIKQSLRNLFLTGEGERFMDSKKGGNMRHFLFENYDPSLAEALKFDVRSVVTAYEPRVEILDVQISDEELSDNNAIDVRIVYRAHGITDIQELNLVVRRVR